MLAYLTACLDFDDGTGACAEVPFYEVGVVNLAEEADALRVLSDGVRQTGLGGHAAHLALGEIAEREHDVAQLVIADLGQEVGLVLDGVGGRAEPAEAVAFDHAGIVAGGHLVELMAPASFERQLVSHHVGMWREPLSDGAERVGHDAVPVFLVERHDLERQTVAARY